MIAGIYLFIYWFVSPDYTEVEDKFGQTFHRRLDLAELRVCKILLEIGITCQKLFF